MATTARSPLIVVQELAAALERPHAPVLLDVRWSLGGPSEREQYAEGHLPGAVFVELDTELAAPAGPGGRHPLPEPAAFEAAMRAKGVSGERDVVVYDAGGGLSAARAWWLLRYFGHGSVRLLDGGLAAWRAAGHPLTREVPDPAPGDFRALAGGLPVLDAAGAARVARSGLLLDARTPERFRGEQEPIDPVAGHIPGARNRPATDSLDEQGRWRGGEELRAELARAGAGAGVEIGAYCGSGVTAAHLVLGLELAGFAAALYPGSWSEWIVDSGRPVATGG